LKVKKGMENTPVDVSLNVFGAPESRFCPAKVYEFVHDDKTNAPRL
jgi:electron-transferring-flavoprotein dehydrogenase